MLVCVFCVCDVQLFFVVFVVVCFLVYTCVVCVCLCFHVCVMVLIFVFGMCFWINHVCCVVFAWFCF